MRPCPFLLLLALGCSGERKKGPPPAEMPRDLGPFDVVSATMDRRCEARRVASQSLDDELDVTTHGVRCRDRATGLEVTVYVSFPTREPELARIQQVFIRDPDRPVPVRDRLLLAVEYLAAVLTAEEEAAIAEMAATAEVSIQHWIFATGKVVVMPGSSQAGDSLIIEPLADHAGSTVLRPWKR